MVTSLLISSIAAKTAIARLVSGFVAFTYVKAVLVILLVVELSLIGWFPFVCGNRNIPVSMSVERCRDHVTGREQISILGMRISIDGVSLNGC